MLSLGTEELSPDGRFLVSDDNEGTLRILDVASGQTVFEKKRFVRLIPGSVVTPGQRVIMIGDLGSANIRFSTDSRFLVVWATYGSTLAWDLRDRVTLKLNGELRRLKNHITLHFAFLTQDSY